MAKHDRTPESGALSPEDLATLCDVSSALLGIADFDGHLLWVNPAFVESLGYTREELLGLPTYLDLLHPDDLALVGDLLAARPANGPAPAVDVRVRHRDGSWRLFRSSSTVVGDRVYFSGTDLTDERRHADELARANVSLALFGVGVAHDLRSLLTVIVASAEQLMSLADDPARQGDVEVLSSALARNARRASIFVAALLAVARGEPVDREEVALTDIVRGAVDDVAVDREASGASIEFSRTLPTVWVSPVLLRSTLANLFVNSIRACRAPVPRIVVEASQQGGVVTMLVSDNGPGIAEVDLETVFDPFERGGGSHGVGADTATIADERTGVPSGYGLGLALCRRVVEAHGGRVRARSEPGTGATIIIELPADAPAAIGSEPA